MSQSQKLGAGRQRSMRPKWIDSCVRILLARCGGGDVDPKLIGASSTFAARRPLPTFGADEWDESHGAQRLLGVVIANAPYANQFLTTSLGTDGNYETTTLDQLVTQCARNSWSGCGHDDGVEGSSFGNSERAVAFDDVDAVESLRLECGPGALDEFGYTFDRPHIPGETTQYRRSVSRPRTDFQNPIIRTDRSRLGHERNDVGLADRLTRSDRQRAVVVRGTGVSEPHEAFSGDSRHGVEYSLIINPAAGNLVAHHLLAFTLAI